MLEIIPELIGQEPSRVTKHAVEKMENMRASLREYRKRNEVLARKSNRHETLKGLGDDSPYDGRATSVGAGTRAYVKDAES